MLLIKAVQDVLREDKSTLLGGAIKDRLMKREEMQRFRPLTIIARTNAGLFEEAVRYLNGY